MMSDLNVQLNIVKVTKNISVITTTTEWYMTKPMASQSIHTVKSLLDVMLFYCQCSILT